MGYRMIYSGHVLWIFVGVFTARAWGPDGLLTFEWFVFEVRFGLIFAALTGLFVSTVDGIIWFASREKPPKVMQLTTPPRM